MTHLFPFQRSASALFDAVDPTATQADGDEHDTAVRKPARRLPDAWMRHLCPVQRSTRVLSPAEPTATQSLARGHDTPISPPPPPRFGVAWRVQLLPSHRTAKVQFLFASEPVM